MAQEIKLTQRVTRSSWKILPLPEEREHFDLPLVFAESQAETLRHGLIPLDMNDRWFIFFEEEWLYFHRSWTGDCIFGVRIDETSGGARVVDAWSSREGSSYNSPGAVQEKQLLTELIYMCLHRHQT